MESEIATDRITAKILHIKEGKVTLDIIFSKGEVELVCFRDIVQEGDAMHIKNLKITIPISIQAVGPGQWCCNG